HCSSTVVFTVMRPPLSSTLFPYTTLFRSIFTGAFTTAGAFLAMYFTNFKGIQEMGLICGGGLLICLVPMMTMLPVLLLRGKQNRSEEHTSELQSLRHLVCRLLLEKKKINT